MALYAVDEDEMIYASEAEEGKVYWCLDCFGPVKRRRGKHRFYHFYHLQSAPHCRLYSKTDDHLLVQLQLKKQFPEGALEMERPFPQISRIADLCWEEEKIVFEIQCSPISPQEAKQRIADYKLCGYDAIWLLDDSRYNKRALRPAEEYLRTHSTYYVHIVQGLNSDFYDQFEVFSKGRRVKRGKKIPLDLRKVRRVFKKTFSEEKIPKQIIQLQISRHFENDRFHRALQNHYLTMQNWRALEIHFAKIEKKPSFFKRLFWRFIGKPYCDFIERLLMKMN